MYSNLNALFTLLITLAIFSCHSNKYTNSAFKNLSRDHSTIAILPPSVTISGKIDSTNLENTKKSISKQTHTLLYNNITQAARWGLNVNIKSPKTTLSLLSDAGIDINKPLDKTPEELCQLLKVDAVIVTELNQNILMSETTSAAVGIAGDILSEVLLRNPSNGIPNPNQSGSSVVQGHTSDIYVSNYIIDSEGNSIWNIDNSKYTSWEISLQEALNTTTRNVGQNFPYKLSRKEYKSLQQ